MKVTIILLSLVILGLLWSILIIKLQMALTKAELLQVLQIVKDLQQTDANDKSQIDSLKAQASQFQADHDLVNDPDITSAFDAVVANAAAAPVVPPVV